MCYISEMLGNCNKLFCNSSSHSCCMCSIVKLAKHMQLSKLASACFKIYCQRVQKVKFPRNQVSSAFQNYANKVSRKLCLVTDLNALRTLIVLYNIIIKFHKQFETGNDNGTFKIN